MSLSAQTYMHARALPAPCSRIPACTRAHFPPLLTQVAQISKIFKFDPSGLEMPESYCQKYDPDRCDADSCVEYEVNMPCFSGRVTHVEPVYPTDAIVAVCGSQCPAMPPHAPLACTINFVRYHDIPHAFGLSRCAGQLPEQGRPRHAACGGLPPRVRQLGAIASLRFHTPGPTVVRGPSNVFGSMRAPAGRGKIDVSQQSQSTEYSCTL